MIGHFDLFINLEGAMFNLGGDMWIFFCGGEDLHWLSLYFKIYVIFFKNLKTIYYINSNTF